MTSWKYLGHHRPSTLFIEGQTVPWRDTVWGTDRPDCQKQCLPGQQSCCQVQMKEYIQRLRTSLVGGSPGGASKPGGGAPRPAGGPAGGVAAAGRAGPTRLPPAAHSAARGPARPGPPAARHASSARGSTLLLPHLSKSCTTDTRFTAIPQQRCVLNLEGE